MQHKTLESITLSQISATKGHRFANAFVDGLIIRVLIEIISYVIIGDTNDISGDYILERALILVVFALGIQVGYYILMEGNTGKTLGKMLTKTIVVDERGEKITYKEALTRSLCRLIPFEALSFLGSDARGWHDSISKTYVVYEEKWKEAAAGGFESLIDEIGKRDIETGPF